MNTLGKLLAQTAEPELTLTAGGALIMTVSVLIVLALMGFCFWRLLREPRPSEHHRAPLDIETGDRDQ